MKSGLKTCPTCHTRMEFATYELVDCLPGEPVCLGCVRLLAILAESKRRKAAQPEPPEPVDLSASANLARLLAFRTEPEPVDFAKRAAGDWDE